MTATSAIVTAAPFFPQVLFEPATLPSTSLSGLSPQTWEGDLLVLAVTQEDCTVEGEW